MDALSYSNIPILLPDQVFRSAVGPLAPLEEKVAQFVITYSYKPDQNGEFKNKKRLVFDYDVSHFDNQLIFPDKGGQNISRQLRGIKKELTSQNTAAQAFLGKGYTSRQLASRLLGR